MPGLLRAGETIAAKGDAQFSGPKRDVSGQILDTPLPHGRSVWI